MSGERQVERGLVLVFTGDGKGKTTAALGTALRAVGYGERVAIIMFIKGTWHTGELSALARLPEIEVHRTGEGFFRIQDDDKPEQVHRDAARRGLALAREKVLGGEHRVVILDEINVAVHAGLLDVQDVLQLMADRPGHVDLILTGRNAAQEVVKQADLVTEMREVKHPFQKGITARKGIDY